MENILNTMVQVRKRLHSILDLTPKEQLLQIPEGFRNNIWWNIAHVVVTQQLLVYRFSGLQIRIPEGYVDKYRKGTVPGDAPSDEEIKEVAALLISTVEWMEEDYRNGLFKNYQSYTTSANVTLGNVDEAIAFNLFHEGLHIGAIIALQKMLK
ncbi:DinB family protein [Pseudozobellia thermophila]|uniref:DinB superfamily protein n=1 Tax=Pseudozobellia thermophila TaxID=192903 RepID=A0A1M6AVN3_9FLAO|nr:DinB family protein [Pseudozobellia thermophila]SHI40471.1 DinB superfamily protein [Pseudozobellia thermophila]